MVIAGVLVAAVAIVVEAFVDSFRGMRRPIVISAAALFGAFVSLVATWIAAIVVDSVAKALGSGDLSSNAWLLLVAWGATAVVVTRWIVRRLT